MKNVFIAACLILGLGIYASAEILVFSPNGSYVKTATLAEANSAADVAGKTVVVTSALSAVQSNISSATVHGWRSDAALKVEKGGSINPTTKFTGLPYAEPEWFGAVGDGTTDDTTAINKAIAAVEPGIVQFNPSTYLYAGGGVLGVGTHIKGAGREATIIKASTATGTLFDCFGSGCSIEDIAFDAAVTQTGGSYVLLRGKESFIDNFFMNGDYNGILMTGSVSRIRHGRFQDGATGAIRIRAEGGDNSQGIDDVLMGAQTPANVASAGIRVRDSSALMITNTSVIQQGVGLLIDPTSSGENVFSLYVDNCFFDNGTYGIKISTSGGGGVYRSRFSNVWTGSSSSDGVFIAGLANGIHFESLHSLLNTGSGVNVGSGVTDLAIHGGEISQNAYGVFIDQALTGLNISNAIIGAGAGFGTGNTNSGIALDDAGITNVVITGNNLAGNGAGLSDSSTGTKFISGNIGHNSNRSGTGVIGTGNSSVVITHGLNGTPIATDISITPTVPIGANGFYLDTTTITATEFTVRVPSAVSGPATFVWQARVGGS